MMNKSKRRVPNSGRDEEDSEESTESLLLENEVEKLLDVGVGRRKKGIFLNAEENQRKIRKSLIKRALRNVVSSTPMPSKANIHYFSTDCSLNISPINSENETHNADEENGRKYPSDQVTPDKPKNVEHDIISVSSDPSGPDHESSGRAKCRDLPSKTYFTRSQSTKLGEKTSPNQIRKNKRIGSHGAEVELKVVNSSTRDKTHLRLPFDDTSTNEEDKSKEKSENESKCSSHSKPVDKKSNRIELESADKTYKLIEKPSESIDKIDTLKNSYEIVASEFESRPSDVINKSSNASKLDGKSLSSDIIHQKNLDNENSNEKPANDSTFSRRSSVTNACLSAIQESSHVSEHMSIPMKTPTKMPVRTLVKTPVRTPRSYSQVRQESLMNSRQNVTLRKSNQIESSAKKKKNAVIEENLEIGNKEIKKFAEKSSRIPISRTRSKSREKPNNSESQPRDEPREENIQVRSNRNKENKKVLSQSSHHPTLSRRKQQKSTIIQSCEKRDSIHDTVEDFEIIHKSQISFRYSNPDKSLHRVGTSTSEYSTPNMNAVPAEINNYLINNSVEQDTEISSSPKQKGSSTVSSPIGTTEAVPNQVVDTAISPTCLESSKFNLSKKEERCKRLDNLISKMRKEKSAIVQSKVVTSQPPLKSALESNSMTRDRQVQTSLNKSNEASQKLDPSKKTCARKIFTNTIAEGETNSQLDLNSHNSSSSGMTDMSKALEEYDEGNLFISLAKGPMYLESFDDDILDDSEGMARVPWRYEDQSQSHSNGVNLSFLRSAYEIEEGKLLKKKQSDTDFDSSSSDLENSGNKIDCVSKNKRKSVPRSRSTFRYYRKKGSAKDTRNIENNRAPSSARGSDDGEENIQGTIDYPKRLSLGKNLQEKPQKEAVQNDVEPEENTLIDDTENRNTCNNLIVFQSNNLSRIKKSEQVVTEGIIAETHKNQNQLESISISAEKENRVPTNILGSDTSSPVQKTHNPHLDYEKVQVSEQCKDDATPRNTARREDMKNISENNENKKNVSTHSDTEDNIDTRNNSSVESGLETDASQKQTKSAYEQKSENKKEGKFQNSPPGIETNGKTDTEEMHEKHLSSSQLDFHERSDDPVEIFPHEDYLEKEATANSLSRKEKQHQLSVVLRRLSKKTFEVKRNKNIKKTSDSEGEDDASAKSTKNSFSQMKHFKSFSDLAVPLNQTEMVAVQDTPVTVNNLENIAAEAHTESLPKNTPINKRTGNKKPEEANANEAHTESQPQNTSNNKRTGNKKPEEANANEAHTESQSKNTPNNERTGNKKTEPVFKVPETKPRKTARKRIFPKNNSDDICIESECPPSTGSRKSARDRKPPTIKYFIQEVYEIHEKPMKKSVKCREESAKKHKLENDKEKKESTTKRRGTSKNSILAVKDNVGNDEDQGKCTTKKRGGSKSSTPAVNGIENDQDRRTITAKKRGRPKSKTTITVSEPSSEQNEDGSTTGPETSGKRTKMDKHIESNSSEIDTVSENHDINTSSSQDNPNRFEYGNEDQELDNDMFLRIPDPRNMVSQDSGTSTLLRSNTFDNSNLLSIKRSRKNDGPKENKISKVLSEPGSVSPIKGDIPMSKDRRMTRNSLVQNDSVDIQSGSEIVRLKYVEREPQFKTCQDDLLLTSFIRNINGTTMGYLKVPAGKIKPVHKTKKHSLCFFVLEGEGRIQVHDKTSKIQKMSRFVVPLGLEYAIMNDGPDEMLLACVKVEGT